MDEPDFTEMPPPPLEAGRNVASYGITERTDDELRYEAAESGRALAAAYDANEMASFHFNLGRVWSIAGVLYDRNKRAELGIQYPPMPPHPDPESDPASPTTELWDSRDKTEGRS